MSKVKQSSKNPWETIDESPPEFQVGDIVYVYLTFGDEFINVPAKDLPRHAFVHMAKGEVVGFDIGESDGHELPIYRVKTLEILLNRFGRPLFEVGSVTGVHRGWVEQGDDAYRRYFKKRPRHMEFRFR